MLYKSMGGTAYIRTDNRKYVKIWERCISVFSKLLIRVRPEKVNDGVILLIPSYKCYNKFIESRLLNQINEYVSIGNYKNLIVENTLSFLKEKIDSKKLLNGKYLMKNLLLYILEYIFVRNKNNMNLENIYIFVNEYSQDNVCIIKKLVTKFKTVNIITENLRYYKRLEDELFNKGILITVSNNKKKSAKNAKYVVNMDFEGELFEKYTINVNTVLINLSCGVNPFKKKHSGVVVNDFEISIDSNISDFISEIYGEINMKFYIESYIINSAKKSSDLEKIYNGYHISISELIGLRGVLEDEEFFI